jgi:integrase
MNRPRKKDRHLPPAVYHRHGAYYLVRKGRWIRLASELSAALREYARLAVRPVGAMSSFIDDMLPRILRGRAATTQHQYKHCAELIRDMMRELSPEDVTQRDVRALQRELADTPAIANRTLTVLSLLLAEAVHDELIGVNPVLGVKRLPMQARTRRVTVEEYRAIRRHADPLLRAVLALCYATGQRVGDVLAIKAADILDEGIYFEQAKTGSRVIVGWTSELRAAVAEARALKPNVIRAPYLFGHEQPTYTMVRKRWERAIKAAKVGDIHMHDIRAMSGTDADAQGIDAQALLGHKDRRTTAIYLRDKTVPVVPGPVMGARRKAG